MISSSEPSNFGFLVEHDQLFVDLANAAEYPFSSDPNTTLPKLRQLGQAMAQHIAVLEQQFINQLFRDDGGVQGVNNRLGNWLDEVLDKLKTHLWQAS